jgi:hypothetical protein
MSDLRRLLASEHIEESNVRRRRRNSAVSDSTPPPRRFSRERESHNAMRSRLGVFLHTAQSTSPSNDEARPSRSFSHKKRKLVHEPDVAPHQYGWRGQVEPGHLRLEVASFEGGHWSADDKYSVENVLKSDHNVYCSNSPTCHILFKHQAGATFHLDHLVVKAPRSDYTAP